MLIPFGRKWDKAAAPEVSTERLVNCFLEREGSDARTPNPIYQRPGLVDVSGDLGGTSRGSFVYQDRMHFVMGNRLYRIDDDETVTVLEGVLPGFRPVTGGPTETEAFLVSRPSAWRFDGSAVALISDPDLPDVLAGTVAKGFGIASRNDTSGQFYLTRNRNIASVDALDFASAESAPDTLRRPWWSQNTLLLFGTDMTEPWFPQTGVEFPFAQRSDVIIPVGIASPYAVADQDNTTIFLAHDLTVRRLNGFSPVVISEPGHSTLFGAQQDLGEAEAWPFDLMPSQAVAQRAATSGHKFWFLSFRNLTMAHDSASAAWHEWQTHQRQSFTGRHFIRAPWKEGAATNGYWYCAGVDEPKIYRMDPDVNTDDGRVMVRDMISPPLGALQLSPRASVRDELAWSEVSVEVTTGSVATGSSAPNIRLRWSDDAGRTWSPWNDRGLGATGQRNVRVQWNGLGQARSRVYNLRVTDDVNVAVLNASADVELRAL